MLNFDFRLGLLKHSFDLDEYYERGFTENEITPTVADGLLQILKEQRFVRPEDVFGGDIYDTKEVSTQYGDVVEPSTNVALKQALAWSWSGLKHPLIWEKGLNGKDDPSLFTTYPEDFQDFFNRLVDSSDMNWFTNTLGRFTRFGMLAHKYEVGQGLGWHHDLSDSTHMICIVYLGDRHYQIDDGGYLEIGSCTVDSEGVPNRNQIRLERDICPTHGKIVFIDNRRPTLLHRVPMLEHPVERYTLSCQLGYIENLMAKKFKREHD